MQHARSELIAGHTWIANWLKKTVDYGRTTAKQIKKEENWVALNVYARANIEAAKL